MGLLAWGKLRALDAGGADSFQPQLFFMYLLNPTMQIGQPVKHSRGSLCLYEGHGNFRHVVAYPLWGGCGSVRRNK